MLKFLVIFVYFHFINGATVPNNAIHKRVSRQDHKLRDISRHTLLHHLNSNNLNKRCASPDRVTLALPNLKITIDQERCDKCLSSQLCSTFKQCGFCTKYCQPSTTSSDKVLKVFRSSTENPRLNMSLAPRIGAEHEDVVPKQDTYYTFATLETPARINLLTRLLNLKSEKNIEKMIVLAKLKDSKQLTDRNEPLILDVSQAFHETNDTNVFVLTRNGFEDSPVIKSLNSKLTDVIGTRNNSQVSLADIDRIIDEVLEEKQNLTETLNDTRCNLEKETEIPYEPINVDYNNYENKKKVEDNSNEIPLNPSVLEDNFIEKPDNKDSYLEETPQTEDAQTVKTTDNPQTLDLKDETSNTTTVNSVNKLEDLRNEIDENIFKVVETNTDKIGNETIDQLEKTLNQVDSLVDNAEKAELETTTDDSNSESSEEISQNTTNPMGKTSKAQQNSEPRFVSLPITEPNMLENQISDEENSDSVGNPVAPEDTPMDLKSRNDFMKPDEIPSENLIKEVNPSNLLTENGNSLSFGEITPVSKNNDLMHVMFMGDGIRLPLQMHHRKDGNWQLTVDVNKLCNCGNRMCQHKDLDNEIANDRIGRQVNSGHFKQISNVAKRSPRIENSNFNDIAENQSKSVWKTLENDVKKLDEDNETQIMDLSKTPDLSNLKVNLLDNFLSWMKNFTTPKL